jgi:hypothetical protein
LALPLPVSYFWALKKAKKPGDYKHGDNGQEKSVEGLTLECPSCHCPHSWVMPQKEVFVDEHEGSITTTTTRKGYGQGDVVSSLFEGFKSDGTTTKTTETHVYNGREFRDFKCLNCGHHTERNEFKASWSGSRPEEGMRYFDPPMPAWMPDWLAKQIEGKKTEAEYEQKNKAREEYEKTMKSSVEDSGISDGMFKMAEMGDEKAKMFIGISYLLGQGVEKDEKKAKKWISSDYYYKSDGSFDYYRLGGEAKNSMNITAIISLYEMAVAERGSMSSFFLGDIYSGNVGQLLLERGVRNIIDKEKARHWYQKSADFGNKDAKKRLKELK